MKRSEKERTHSYPQISTLMGGWFHQDFDLEGDSLEEIIAAYQAVTPREEQRALAAEIEHFLSMPGDLDVSFERTFRPDADPKAFAPTTRAFLQRIVELVRVTTA